MKLAFRLNCIPKAQKRPRGRAIKKNGVWLSTSYKDAGQRQNEENLSGLLAQYAPPIPFTCPLKLTVKVFLPIPKSKSKKWKTAALTGSVRPTVKPDNSNLIKHLEDVMNGVFFDDDKLIVDLVVSKYYGEVPGYWIELEELV